MKLTEISRKFMPQISGDSIGQAVELLTKNGIIVQKGKISVSKLTHSQEAVNKEKVRNIIRDIKRGKKMPPLIISNDNYIVDGHHRWIAYKLLDPNMIIKVIRINLPKQESIVAYKKVENEIKANTK